MIKLILLIGLSFILIRSAQIMQASSRKFEDYATTNHGRRVILYTDGSWEYHELQKKQSAPIQATPPNHKY